MRETDERSIRTRFGISVSIRRGVAGGVIINQSIRQPSFNHIGTPTRSLIFMRSIASKLDNMT